MRRLLPRSPAARALLVAAAAVIAMITAVVGVRVVTAPSDRVPPGVSIAGVEVGGLTAVEAERAVSQLAGPGTGVITLERPGVDGFPMRVAASRLAPIPRARVAVDEAMRPRPVWQRILREVGLGSDREVGVDYRVSGAVLNDLVADVSERLVRPPRNAGVRVQGGAFRLVAARDGRRVRVQRLRSALMQVPDRLVVPVEPITPAVGDAAARAARLRAQRLVAGPVRVTHPRAGLTVPRATLVEAVRFTPQRDGTLDVSLDPAALAPGLEDAFGGLESEPASASFRVQGDSVSVVPGRAGRSVDPAGVARALERGTGARSVRVRLERTDPALTTEQAREMGINELVSEFTTPYTCCPPRVTNIKLGAQALDGTIIPAGGTFSLNEAMGERTRARGFVAAPQINAGELEDAVGGGVSQIATTMFNAAFFAGLNLVSHTPHEFWITRYPAGREATVSWGGPELIIENDWPAAVLVKAQAGDDGITVRLYSSDLGRRVETTSSGNEVAGTAFTSTYTRKVYRGDELVRDEEYSWTYRAPPDG